MHKYIPVICANKYGIIMLYLLKTNTMSYVNYSSIIKKYRKVPRTSSQFLSKNNILYNYSIQVLNDNCQWEYLQTLFKFHQFALICMCFCTIYHLQICVTTTRVKTQNYFFTTFNLYTLSFPSSYHTLLMECKMTQQLWKCSIVSGNH